VGLLVGTLVGSLDGLVVGSALVGASVGASVAYSFKSVYKNKDMIMVYIMISAATGYCEYEQYEQGRRKQSYELKEVTVACCTKCRILNNLPYIELEVWLWSHQCIHYLHCNNYSYWMLSARSLLLCSMLSQRCRTMPCSQYLIPD
jgi:hypothetical protein